MMGRPLHTVFDIVFGTSTGAIIAALLSLGRTVDEICELYEAHVPKVMRRKRRRSKTKALAALGDKVFGDATFEAMQTGVGIVATRWMIELPMIFKASIDQAHGRRGTFSPGFGVTISDAVQASCSAYPFFDRKVVKTDRGDLVELVDGGYCANNPTLFAIADAVRALALNRDEIQVLSVGVGRYPEPKRSPLSIKRWHQKLISVQLLQKTLEVNTQSMEQLRRILYGDIPTIRISDTFEQPEMATDMFESEMEKLSLLRQRGSESFAKREKDLKGMFLG